jgi:hypothetical protein
MRRTHPRWGQRRLQFELGRSDCPGLVPSLTTIYRVLVRHGLINPVPRRRRREDYRRWQRDRPMELWQLDIVDGIHLADGREAKVVTGVDDHSRYCLIAQAHLRSRSQRMIDSSWRAAEARVSSPEMVARSRACSGLRSLLASLHRVSGET